MTEQTQSLWRRTEELPAYPALCGELDTDVAVVGGGMAGLLTAYLLTRRGIRATVLEAGRIAGGQTGGSAARITSQHGLAYQRLERRLGPETARLYALANQAAVELYADIIRTRRISCNFRRLSAYLYARRDPGRLRREVAAAERAGLPVRLVRDTGLPFPAAGALRLEGQACFHPLRFLRGICPGLEIYEHTPVLSASGKRLRTPGGTVRAQRVVFAGLYPFRNTPGWYFARLRRERGYLLALESEWLPEGLYDGVDADGLSLRPAGRMLVVAGAGHPAGQSAGGVRYDWLRRRTESLLPVGAEREHWSIQDCLSLDGLPYIGRFAPETPGWYVATGFGRWGMTGSMVAALTISEHICGVLAPWSGIFDPARFHGALSAGNLTRQAASAALCLARRYLPSPRGELERLPPGFGGVISVDGRKLGVYKDERGRCHVVDPHCPHLGCRLEWNGEERSWDCPCHGSRFDCDGRVLEGPAGLGLKKL
jgi:glycine/D-amino acid oxidase-like deaminating enzyme/nitrite reductase/ring-hydroxylating ferredoxin subunit